MLANEGTKKVLNGGLEMEIVLKKRLVYDFLSFVIKNFVLI